MQQCNTDWKEHATVRPWPGHGHRIDGISTRGPANNFVGGGGNNNNVVTNISLGDIAGALKAIAETAVQATMPKMPASQNSSKQQRGHRGKGGKPLAQNQLSAPFNGKFDTLRRFPRPAHVDFNPYGDAEDDSDMDSQPEPEMARPATQAVSFGAQPLAMLQRRSSLRSQGSRGSRTSAARSATSQPSATSTANMPPAAQPQAAATGPVNPQPEAAGAGAVNAQTQAAAVGAINAQPQAAAAGAVNARPARGRAASKAPSASATH